MRNAMDAQEVAIGWWPGDPRYGRAAFYAYAHPAPEGFSAAALSPAATRWETSLGEYVLDWDDVRADPGPTRSRARIRSLGVPARLRGVRMGYGAPSQRGREPRHPSREQTSDRRREIGCGAAAERRPIATETRRRVYEVMATLPKSGNELDVRSRQLHRRPHGRSDAVQQDCTFCGEAVGPPGNGDGRLPRDRSAAKWLRRAGTDARLLRRQRDHTTRGGKVVCV